MPVLQRFASVLISVCSPAATWTGKLFPGILIMSIIEIGELNDEI